MISILLLPEIIVPVELITAYTVTHTPGRKQDQGQEEMRRRWS